VFGRGEPKKTWETKWKKERDTRSIKDPRERLASSKKRTREDERPLKEGKGSLKKISRALGKTQNLRKSSHRTKG
jgi:hypothetical protein